MTWEPPPWIIACVAWLRRIAWMWQSVPAPQRRRRLLIASGSLLAICLIGVVLVLRPRPVPPLEISVRVVAPTPPPSRKANQPAPDPGDLRLNLSGSAAPLDKIGHVISEGVQLQPALAGTWRWDGDSSLVFTPKIYWPVGQSYTVTLKPEVLRPQAHLERYTYQFSTQAFDARLVEAQFYQDPIDPHVKRIVATLRFNYPLDANTLGEHVTMTRLDAQGSEHPLAVTYTFDDLRFEAYAHSENLIIALDDERVRVHVRGGIGAIAGGPRSSSDQKRDVTIPGRENLLHFASTEVALVRNEQFDPEQVLMLTSSTSVLESKVAEALSAWVLPEDLPAANGRKAQKHYSWLGRQEHVGPEVLAHAQPIRLTPVPAEREYTNVHAFRMNIPPQRDVYVRVRKGLESFGGFTLGHDYTQIVRVPAYPREVRIMHEGSILSLTGARRLNVMTRGLPAVRLQVSRIFPSAINHLVSQTRGDFQNPRFNSFSFDERNIAEVFHEVRNLDSADPIHPQYTTIDLGQWLVPTAGMNHGMFLLEVQAWDPLHQRVMDARTNQGGFLSQDDQDGDANREDGDIAGDADGSEECEDCTQERDASDQDQYQDRRFVLLTDLGVVVKDELQRTHRVFVQSFQNGAPVVDANVDVIGKNGLSVLNRHTDAEGSAVFPDLKDFTAERTPVAYLVQHGADVSFLPFTRSDRQLNFSRFDVGGEVTRGRNSALTAYAFSDRGIYRPGDTFHVGVIVKANDWRGTLAGIPLQAVITDPRGLVVRRYNITLDASGFVDMHHAAEINAPTGTYTIAIHTRDEHKTSALLGSTTVKIEEFLPDRLRITARIADALGAGWLHPDSIRGEVQLHNLFGTPAVDHTVTARLVLQPGSIDLPAYRDYAFTDPKRAKQGYVESLDDCTTDNAGVCRFDLNLKKYTDATYALRLQVDGMEKAGGRGVSTEASVLVSPARFLVGVRLDGDLQYVQRDSTRAVQVIAVDAAGKKIKVDNLYVVQVERRYVSVLVRADNGTYVYQSVLKDITGKRDPLRIAEAGTTLNLPTRHPGTFYLAIRDAADTELGRVDYSVAGTANLSRDLERNAELEVLLNRRDYAPGDTIEVQIKAPYTGAGLITLERDQIYAHKWFKTTTTSSIQTLTLPAGMEGNGYVNVTFLRGLDSPEIFMSPLSYGVVPFSVNRKERTVDIDLDAAANIQPGETLTMQYHTSQPARIVIFAVDEGILQVAHYETPNPLAAFFQKRALEVETRQILDLLLPESTVVRNVSKIGGDQDMAALRHNLNPFKRKTDAPVAFWSGILAADATPRSVRYKVPDYFNGSLRVMAVAVAETAMGAATRKTTVSGPFVLSPSLPLFVTPGDIFDASVAVANLVKDSGKNAQVRVNVAVSDNLELLDKGTQSIALAEQQEGAVHFRMRAKADPQAATVDFSAAMGAARSHTRSTLSVRPVSPYHTRVQAGYVRGQGVSIPMSRQLFPRLSHRRLTVSALPTHIATGLGEYLEQYPYLCTEQLVSMAAPAVALRHLPGVSQDDARAKQVVDRTLTLLQGRQNSAGGFGLWTATEEAAPVPTSHTALFLTEASEAGFSGVQDVLHRTLAFMQTLAQVPLHDLDSVRTRAEAIYVLTRNGRTPGAALAELRAFMAGQGNALQQDAAKNDVAWLFMAGAYAMLRDDAAAAAILKSIPTQIPHIPVLYFDDVTHAAIYLYMLSRHFPDKLPTLQDDLLQRITQAVQAQQFNSFSSAWIIDALGAYARAINARQGGAPLQGVHVRSLGDTPTDLPLSAGLLASLDLPGNAKGVELQAPSDLGVFYTATEAGFDVDAPADAHGEHLEILHHYVKDGAQVHRVGLGQQIEVHIQLRGVENPVWQVAVVDLLPGGFDVVGTDGNELVAPGSTWRPDHIDVREDRVVLYGDVPRNAQELIYRIRAVAKGEYRVPPAYAEAMYDRTVWARSAADHIAVVGE